MSDDWGVTEPYRHLYVHVPFCARRCSYCDFSIAVRRVVPTVEYIAGVVAELTLRNAAAECDRLQTVYLGGGTPSRLGAEGVHALLHGIRQMLPVDRDAEVTLEANPEDMEPDAVRAWRGAGVTRLSIGVQSFDDRVLQWMHRTHDAQTARAALTTAHREGLDAFSADLIFSVPEALQRDWQRDVEEVLRFRPEHVSLYGLTVEPHTPLGRWSERGTVVESPEERYEAEFLFAHERLATAGFEHYEVSNFALSSRRARHNSAYWTGAPYLGVGPSAHGYDGLVRRWNIDAFPAWLRTVADGRDPIGGSESLTAANRTAESAYLGLRTNGGIAVRDSDRTLVAPWLASGWVEWVGTGQNAVRCTPIGWLRLDSLAAALTALRSH